MSFQDEMRKAVEDLKSKTHKAINSAYSKIYCALTDPNFDWTYASFKFSSMEKDAISNIALKAEKNFRMIAKQEAGKAKLDESSVERYWAYVYRRMDKPMPDYKYTDMNIVDTVAPQILLNHTQPAQEVTAKKVSFLNKLSPFLKSIIKSSSSNKRSEDSTRGQSGSDEKKDWTALQMLCGKCAERASQCFDEWYQQSLDAALEVWSRDVNSEEKD